MSPLGIAWRVVAWGAVLFAAWYFAAQPIGASVGWMASRWVEGMAPVDRVKSSAEGRQLTFQVEPDDGTIRRARMRPDAVLDVATNPLQHTFGIPFFLALLLAARPPGAWWKALLGCAVLLVFASFGLACDVVIRIGSLAGPDGAPLFRFHAAAREAISLAYQLGTLIFPTVIPVLLWGAMNRVALARLLEGARRR